MATGQKVAKVSIGLLALATALVVFASSVPHAQQQSANIVVIKSSRSRMRCSTSKPGRRLARRCAELANALRNVETATRSPDAA